MERIFRVRDVTQQKDAHVLAFKVGQQMMDPYEIVLRPLKAKRSGDQNKRYWALLREVAATVWVNGRQFSDEVWHEQFKRIFIGLEEITLPDGGVESRGISTTTLNISDMGRYMDEICQWCLELGFPVMEAAA